MNKILTPCQKRCQDCANLKIKNGIWYCEECFGQKVDEIDDCPEGFTLEAILDIEKKEKENHVKNVVKTSSKTERTPRERKPDEEKETIIAEIASFLTEKYENVNITNVSKLIEFDIGENHYKLDLIRQRKAKKS